MCNNRSLKPGTCREVGEKIILKEWELPRSSSMEIQPPWCNCILSPNPYPGEKILSCSKCGATPPYVYRSACGFAFAEDKALCPKCHDEIDDCEPYDLEEAFNWLRQLKRSRRCNQ